MSHFHPYCDYGMARPLTVSEAEQMSGENRRHLYRLLKAGAIRSTNIKGSPIDGVSLLKFMGTRNQSVVPGMNVVTYSLKGLMSASGRGRSYVLKMVAANNIKRFYILYRIHFEKSACDIAMRKEDPLCR